MPYGWKKNAGDSGGGGGAGGNTTAMAAERELATAAARLQQCAADLEHEQHGAAERAAAVEAQLGADWLAKNEPPYGWGFYLPEGSTLLPSTSVTRGRRESGTTRRLRGARGGGKHRGEEVDSGAQAEWRRRRQRRRPTGGPATAARRCLDAGE
jgi:hypothetical protein